MATTDPVSERTRTGHGLCGSISHRLATEPGNVVLCHCGDCRWHTGAALSVDVLVPRDALEVQGNPRSYRTVGAENGNLRDRTSCGDCGTPTFTVLHEQPDPMIVKGGTLDDPSGLVPAVEVWGRRAQHWIDPSPHRGRFEGDAERSAVG